MGFTRRGAKGLVLFGLVMGLLCCSPSRPRMAGITVACKHGSPPPRGEGRWIFICGTHLVSLGR